MKEFSIFKVFLLVVTGFIVCQVNASGVRLKDIARIEGKREVALIGYGIVVGLSGSGDSSRNRVTLQSLSNTLNRLGLSVSEDDITARNVAAVMITAKLPAYSEPGDNIDLRVASIGDARGLSGGSLLLAPLYGPDEKLYVLGQGALTVGGYHVESFSNITKKNHSTVGLISGGGSVEQSSPEFIKQLNYVTIILKEPDYTTANRIVNEIKKSFEGAKVEAIHPGKIKIEMPEAAKSMSFISRLESIYVEPDLMARVIVNERTGTIVGGANVAINQVSIAHGNLQIEIKTKFDVSQPDSLIRPGTGIKTAVVPNTDIKVSESLVAPIEFPAGTTVGNLVTALHKIKMSTRDIISILDSIKAAGALHADLIIQ